MTVEEFAPAQNVKPMTSTDDWAADIFETDEELEAFLTNMREASTAALLEGRDLADTDVASGHHATSKGSCCGSAPSGVDSGVRTGD